MRQVGKKRFRKIERKSSSFVYVICSGVTLCVTLCVTCYVNNMHARCPYKTHLRFIQAECEVSNG